MRRGHHLLAAALAQAGRGVPRVFLALVVAHLSFSVSLVIGGIDLCGARRGGDAALEKTSELAASKALAITLAAAERGGLRPHSPNQRHTD